ncbi:MAG TPA: ankyrin repeat domain-containing protein [Chitinophagaceae bacterium]|nr:ankyrin repeat domain-containing protein [Chitinophagaceae bacterium]
MNNSDIKDPLFRKAVDAIDTGNLDSLKDLLNKNPSLISKRIDTPTEGYFANPYLIWFVADNPIRNDKLAANIIDITGTLIQYIQQHAPGTLQEQIDYTLGLIATGRIPRESGLQIELMDLLIDAGAKPGNGIGALAHGNKEAAKHLIKRGGELTLTTAIGLDQVDDLLRLLNKATTTEKQIALIASAFLGRADMIKLLIEAGADVNVYIDRESGFHSHATALHQAVYSGSIESVKLLINGGAYLNAKDRIYDGTPLDWAKYMQKEEKDKSKRKKFAEIQNYLISKLEK